jgi:flagellar hook-associated protein 1 FlgK
MPGFNVSFSSAADALSAIQRALDSVQNNILNASTPGYAAERVRFSARSFDVQHGLTGGVDVSLSSTRDQYLEQSVRSESSALGLLEQNDPLLSSIQSAFSASGDSGVPGALSTFAASFSALATSPNDASARAGVLQAAAAVAQAFNRTATQISQISTDVTQQAYGTVAQINALASHIAALNTKIQSGAQNDAGVAADLNNSLETLSGLVNISVSHASDGSVAVLLDGQTPLAIGQKPYALTIQNQPADPAATYPNSVPGIQLVDQEGTDVTAQASQGKLGALLETRNQTIPGYLGDRTTPGSLNRLATAFAQRVNQILTTGQVSAGPPPVQGAPLFIYTSDTTSAATLSVNPSITAAQIATIDPGPPATTNPASSNGVATELGNLTNPANSADLIDGASYTSFYGLLAGQAGAASAQTSTDLKTQQDMTAQAQNQRSQASGVSLNDQAAQLLALQQAYQATAKIITILQSLSQTTVNLIPQA